MDAAEILNPPEAPFLVTAVHMSRSVSGSLGSYKVCVLYADLVF